MMLAKKIMVAATFAMLLAINPLQANAADKATSTKLTSAEVGTLATIAAIDTDEIMLGVLASNKNPSSGIADFAKMMIDQHGSNLTQILQMVNTLHALPLTGGEADKMAADGKKAMLTLGGLDGTQFATAYVDAMVKGHQAALDLIDQHLMKTAKSDEVKQFLTSTREAVSHHLEEAKKLQAEMKA